MHVTSGFDWKWIIADFHTPCMWERKPVEMVWWPLWSMVEEALKWDQIKIMTQVKQEPLQMEVKVRQKCTSVFHTFQIQQLKDWNE